MKKMRLQLAISDEIIKSSHLTMFNSKFLK